MEMFHIVTYQVIQPPIPVTLDISWMEHPTELASLMGHGVAVLLLAYVCTSLVCYYRGVGKGGAGGAGGHFLRKGGTAPPLFQP